MNTAVEVCTDWSKGIQVVGRAFFTRHRGRVSTTFIYDPGYLADGNGNIDPALVLDPGPQHYDGLLPAFADSAPDRWGRTLIEKAERLTARDENRPPRALDEVDFLLGVSDEARQGALRYRVANDRPFLDHRGHVPALIEVPRLLNAARHVDLPDEASTAIKELLDTGTTGLGGARPKASVRLADGSLAIAKFPHASDRWNVMAWEATMLDLLDRAGVHTPQRELVHVGDSSVLMLRRFDRSAEGERVSYISAMTATGSRDGDRRDYLDILDAMRDLSYDLPMDVRELFDRVVVSVALGNTDDHLRNHGFLGRGNQWALSPVFDVNPNPDPARHRSTTLAGAETPADEVRGLLDFARLADLSEAEARSRIRHVASALAEWRVRARANGIAEHEIRTMAEGIEPRLRRVTDAGTAGNR